MKTDTEYKQCTKCHGLKLATAFNKKRNACKQCQADSLSAYRKKNKELCNARVREWRKKNKLKTKAYWSKYYSKNKKRLKAYQDQYHANHPLYRAAYYAKNRDRCIEYQSSYLVGTIKVRATTDFFQALQFTSTQNTKPYEQNH